MANAFHDLDFPPPAFSIEKLFPGILISSRGVNHFANFAKSTSSQFVKIEIDRILVGREDGIGRH